MEKKDHRLLNKELEFYFLSEEIGQGLPIFLPNFVNIKNKIKDFIRAKWKKYGYQEVETPVIGDCRLYETSCHLKHYEEYMFPKIEKKNEGYYLRPMTCPHHCIIFKNKFRSYKELPIRISENSLLFRYESSGSLKGIERTRLLEIPDHHIFIEPEEKKILEEIKKNILFIQECLSFFKVKIDRVVCSLHDSEQKGKYHEDKNLWEKTEKILSQSLNETNIKFIEKKGEAAFYGPKIDFECQTSDKNFITISTLQLDFFLPLKFNLSFLDRNKEKKTPVIIHQSLIGSYQRFISLLIEQNEGKMPFWLLPLQIAIIPINNEEKTLLYCKSIEKKLQELKLETKIFLNNKTLNYNLREVYKKKIPFYLVIGKEEIKKKEVEINDVFKKKKIVIQEKNIKKKVRAFLDFENN